MLPCSARPARVIAPEHPRLARPTIAACPQPSALGARPPHGPSPPALAAGVAADLLWADPRAGHPVAGFGAVAAATERVVHRDSRLAGHGVRPRPDRRDRSARRAAERAVPGSLPTAGVTALATWAVVGGTSLRREAHEMSRLLDTGDLDGARQRLSHLCGRDPSRSTQRASRARPSSPSRRTPPTPSSGRSCGAPSAASRAPGLPRRQHARRDGRPPLAALRALRAGRPRGPTTSPTSCRRGSRPTSPSASRRSWAAGSAPRCAVWQRDGHKHPSPERRPVEAAFAGALCRTLGGRLSYAGASRTGRCSVTGPAPGVHDIARAARLSGAVTAGRRPGGGTRLVLDRARR
jgi:adenosylcobinamide-phosphate synthase